MELFIFSQHEEPLAVISEDTGLVEAFYRIEVNGLSDEPFTLTVESDHPYAKHIKEENKVVFKDHEGDWRLTTIKEIDDSNGINGPITVATCEPTFAAELTDHMVVERRFVERTADVALAAAVNGTRWQGAVEVELGKATTNFYYISSLEAIWKTIDTWGGELKDVVELDKNTNKIKSCYIKIIQRLGSEQGQRFEIDHNTTEIGRTVLSYPKTALYGRGASLEIEDEEGNHTGGYTRYIDFGDVEWSVAKGDPVDKPKGQKWVGDPEALEKYGILENGLKRHRDGEFSNQDYEDPADLLQATWEALQNAKKPEVNYRLSIELFDEKVSLGDTCQAIDRKFARPIEIQARVIAMEYDLMDIEGTMVVEMGQFLDLGDNRLDDLEKEVEGIKNRPPKQIIDEGSYPNIKPGTPVNLEAYGGMEVIQLYWDYASQIYVKHYEVYGSRTEDFVPDSQHLLWRGNTSAFAHTVGTDEVWYYRIRAVNYHGTPSDWSVQVRGATHRVLTEDILWGPELAERMRELHRISDIIGENGVNFDQISQEAKDLINQQARIYTDGEIQATREDVMRDLSEIADDLEYIDGQLVDKVNVGDVYTIAEVDGMFTNTVSITKYETDMNGLVQDLNHQSTLIEQNESEIINRVKQIDFDNETGYLRQSLADVVIQADRIEQTVSNISIGGRNLNLDSNNFSRSVLVSFDGAPFVMVNENISVDEWGVNNATEIRMGAGNATSLLKVYKTITNTTNTIFGEIYTISIYVKNLREDSGMAVRVNGISAPVQSLSPGEAKRVVFTGERSAEALQIQFRSGAETRFTHFVVYGAQVEKGNKETDYSPAPEEMDNRMTQAESSITQLDREIRFKVNVDEIVSEININREGIRLSGALIHLNGLSLIDEAIIQNVHIADGTIERGKLVRAIIGEAQIEDAAVTNAKIGNISADKLNAGAIRGIDVYGSKFRSSNGNNWMDIVGGDIHLEQSNGRYLYLSPSGLYGYNASGSVRFQADSTLVTSAALGTSNANVYLAPMPDGEARVVNYNDIPGDGLINSYRYLPIRASGIYGNFWNINPAITATNLYARPLSGGELRITLNGTTDVYQNVRAAGLVANTLTTNSLAGSSSNLFLRPMSGGEVRITLANTTDNYQAVRASGYYGNFIDKGTDGGIHLYARPAGGGELQVTVRGTTSTYRPVRALDYLPPNSTRESKKHIEVFADNTLDTFREANVYHYLYKWQEDTDKLRLGVMLDEVPDCIIASTGDTLELYSTVGFLWKGLKDTVSYLDEEINWQHTEYQFLNNEVIKINDEISALKQENKALKERVKTLEESAA